MPRFLKSVNFASAVPALVGAMFVAGTVFPLDIEISKAIVIPECNDGIDNDGNGMVDYPEDMGCEDFADNREEDEGPDLFLELSDGVDEIKQGGSQVYNISLRTSLSSPLVTDVKFFLPQYVNLLSASENGRRVGDAVMWSDVLVYPGFVKNLKVSVEINENTPPDTLLFAQVSADDQRAQDTTLVRETELLRAPMEIFVDDGKIYAEPGEISVYKITVRNSFGDDRRFSLQAQLPVTIEFLNASGLFKKDGRTVTWTDEYIKSGDENFYEITAAVERKVPEFTTVSMGVSSEAAFGIDTTTVIFEQLPPSAFDVSMTDDRQFAAPGSEITYNVVISNNQSKLITGADAVVALPTYTEFVSADEGGYWTGKEVFWKNITISPFGKRVLHVTLRVRSDAPIGAPLRNSVNIDGRSAVDITEVSTGSPNALNQRGNSNSNVLLRKTADRSEVKAGDAVRYTIYMRNTLDHPIRNVRVEDRLDLKNVEILNAQSGELDGGRIVWTIPELSESQTWEVSYLIRVKDGVPNGTEIPNVVSVSGEGLENISLTQRVRTSVVGVTDNMPASGAPLDALFSSALSALSALGAWLSKRRILAA